MKTSRISAAVVATLALFAAGHAQAEPAGATGTTAVLNTFSKVWVLGGDVAAGTAGPMNNGTPAIGKNTGSGIMDANFESFKQADGSILLMTTYTRSSNTKNNDNSYMQGGAAFATLTATGVKEGAVVQLPQLNGERAFMRPLIAPIGDGSKAIIFGASEDNNSNNGNPKPVAFVVDTKTGALQQIANNTRGANNLNKPTDLVQAARNAGIQINNPNNQRGPHMVVAVPGTNNTSFIVSNQYNNQAQEASRVTVDPATNAVTVNWWKRYNNNAVHNRPQIVVNEANTYLTAIEYNAQPANIAITATKIDNATGNAINAAGATVNSDTNRNANTYTRLVRAQPNQNKYVAESSIADMGENVAIKWAYTSKARARNGNNGHAGGANVTQLQLFNKATFAPVGEPIVAPANYQRHAHIFATTFGPDGAKAVGVISGSSTGTSKGLLQVFPVGADGKLGVKDPGKMYTVSQYSDVANVQARGKRNPNNQAKGFINGLGGIENPGYGKADGFMPDVKSFNFTTVTGYSTPVQAAEGRRNSLWLSLVPATWTPGLATTPGTTTDKPGTDAAGNPSETGPAPRTSAPGTKTGANDKDDEGDSVVPETGDPANPGDGAGADGRFGSTETSQGCAVSHGSSSSTSGIAGIALALAGILAIRRKKDQA